MIPVKIKFLDEIYPAIIIYITSNTFKFFHAEIHILFKKMKQKLK